MNQNFFEPNLCYEPKSSSFDQYHSSQSSVTSQLPQRSNEDVRLEMAKLIKNNRILLNNNDFPHEETSMEVLLAKERIFKLIQAWDEKQIKSWSFPELLPQFLNDSRTIEQAANLAVQQEQEEQADYEEMRQDREKFMQDTQTFLEKFNRFSFGVTPRVLSIAWERIDKIKYVLKEPEEILELMCKLLEDEYLEKFPDDVTTVLPTEEPENSLSMGECKVTSDNESECDMPAKDDSSPAFTTFSNPLFNDNDDLDSSDDESLPEEELPTEEFKVYSNPLFDEDEINSDKLDPHCFNVESDFIEYLLNRDTFIDSSSKFDFSGKLAHVNPEIKESDFDFEEEIHLSENLLYVNSSSQPLEEHNADEERIKKEHAYYISRMEMLFTINPRPRPTVNVNTIIESLSSLPIPVQDEGEIDVVDELLSDNSIPFTEDEASDSDHQDNPSFPRPPLEPPDADF
nr:hypothetical protein [Tanacetum cinerariifolium]